MRLGTCKQNPRGVIYIVSRDSGSFAMTYDGWAGDRCAPLMADATSVRAAKSVVTRWRNKHGIPGRIVGQELLS